MELWDIYDIDRNKLPGEMVRGSDYRPDEYHLVVHICVFGSDGRMLIQKRQPFKQDFSGLWDITVGGSSVKGENSRQAAHRELLEEVGIDYDFTDVRPHFTVNGTHIFDDFYLIEKDVDETSLSLQYEEVEAVKWATEEEILKMIDEKVFIPYEKTLIPLLFALRKHYGVHNLSK